MSEPAINAEAPAIGLKSFLVDVLSKHARGKRVFDINILRSQPKRSYALFPWASDPAPKIYVEYEMIVLCEKTSLATLPEGTSTLPETSISPATEIFVPIFGLETAIYTIPATSTALLYVSKADTTGLLDTPAPSRLVCNAYLQYYMQHPSHRSKSFRIHVFARAQDQYLFPGSIENKNKRVLADNVLCKWWREVLGESATAVYTKESSKIGMKLFYLLGGYNFLESIAVLSRPTEPTDDKAPKWQYGHPYRTIPAPLPVADSANLTINDLVPAFQDDPKARQLTEWASSPIPYAGQDGDYDEIAGEIRKLKDSSSVLYDAKTKEIQEQKGHERRKLIKDSERDIDGFWEVMGNRGECASGHVAGFFVVVADHAPNQQADSQNDEKQHGTADAAINKVIASPGSLPHSTYIKSWSQIHNVDYSKLSKAAEGYSKWRSELQMACKRVGCSDEEYKRSIYSRFEVENAAASAENNPLKRTEPPKTINTLAVKKKKKIT